RNNAGMVSGRAVYHGDGAFGAFAAFGGLGCVRHRRGKLPVNSQRRNLLTGLAAGAAVLPLLPNAGRAQQAAVERDWSGNNPLRYPDPDIIALEPRFRRYVPFNTPLMRLYTGTLWAEGPAWNGVG